MRIEERPRMKVSTLMRGLLLNRYIIKRVFITILKGAFLYVI